MPTYEYQCKACGHGFELFQSITAPIKRKCPSCGKTALERLIGVGAGVIFKGGGFYQTDYRSEGYKKAEKADSPATESAKSGAADAKHTDAPKPPAEKPKPEKKADSSGRGASRKRQRD
jgi:putative FmdB family regulatory protein